MRQIPWLAAVAALVACSSNPEPNPVPAVAPQSATPTPPPKPAFDPIGQFDFTTLVQGQTVNGSIFIQKREDGTLGGRIENSMMPGLPIHSVVVDGLTVTITSAVDADALTLVLKFANDDDFVGTWAVAGDGGELNGKRKKA